MKASIIVLQEVCAVVLVICIILISSLFDWGMLDLKDLKNKNFTESKYYEKLFQDAAWEVLDYVEYQEQFETEGAYNPEKIVNVVAYRNQNQEKDSIKTPLSGSDKFRYYLIDLENWSKEYVRVENRVETRLYITQDGAIHQAQVVYVNGETVKESDISIQTIKDMDPSLQELLVSDAQYYYGGYYDLEEYQNPNISSAGTVVFFDTQDGAARNTREDAGTASGDTEEVTSEEERVQSQPLTETVTAEESPTVDVQLQETIQKIIDGKLFELEGAELVGILEDLEMAEANTVSTGYVLEEKYRTVGESTILEEFLNESITLAEMQQTYESLEYTLNTIGEEITAYKRMVNKYKKGNSNLQFLVYLEDQNKYYTNIENQADRADLSSYGKEMGSYFYYNENDIVLDTNVDGMEAAFYQRSDSRNNGWGSVIFIGVDTEFPKEDSFFDTRQEYIQLQPWVIVSLAAAIISAFGFFLSFVYLSLAAGRRPEDTEIHLNWFDKIKTEILLAVFCAVCAGIVFTAQSLVRMFNGSDLVGMMIMASGMIFTDVAVFMVFYMSFVRRVKAEEIWTGSLLYWIGSGIQKVIRNWRPSVRILILFGAHVCLTLVLAVTALAWSHARGVLCVLFLLYLLLCGAEALAFLREGVQRNLIMKGIKRIAAGDLEYEIDTQELKGDNKSMGEAINTIGEGLHHAVDESMKNERLKADLITNVSHDIKTPLTSIINYVDLLKQEDLDNERAKSYINVLDAKSQRLKQLTEDLVEASKVSSGNITLQMDRLNFVELVYQTAGEFNEKFEARGLTAVTKLPREPVIILADGRRIWRVIENLYNNVAKYAMENTRVYVDMEVMESVAAFSIKNISEQALNIEASELTERFIRGDVSRSTEGSGLGLSIAQSLTKLMGGTFDIYLDGDLFKVTVTFPVAEKEA